MIEYSGIDSLYEYRQVIDVTVRGTRFVPLRNDDYRWIMSRDTYAKISADIAPIIIVSPNARTLMGVRIIIDDELPFGGVELFIRGEAL